MPDEKITVAPQGETSEDRFERDMEELEAPNWHRNRTLIVMVLALIVVVGAGITYLFMTEKKQIKPTGPVVMQIEILEPRPGKLSNTPTRFRWETVSATKYYSCSLTVTGAAVALIQRASNGPSITLTAEEQSRMAKGASYVWKVDAYGDTGKILAHGESSFDL